MNGNSRRLDILRSERVGLVRLLFTCVLIHLFVLLLTCVLSSASFVLLLTCVHGVVWLYYEYY